MRSSAGIVASLFLIGLVANCGGDDASDGPSGGTGNLAGEAGESSTSGGKGGGGSGGSAGKGGSTALPSAGEGGLGGMGGTPPVGCSEDEDCGDNAQCVDSICKKEDGQTCTSADECLNGCVDGSCTSLLPDGAACTTNAECAHTCIDEICAAKSGVGGDCDVDLPDLGMGGEGGGGGISSGGGGGLSSGGAGGEGGAGALPTSPDCASPLQCFAGKCLTPDGEACTDNVDCVNTCVENICQPKGTIDAACDDASDCAVAALVCDETTAKCKLDLLQQCTDNGQCKSDRCICSDANCSVRVCKAAGSVCQCKWSPPDSVTCNNTSANLNAQTQDPNGCDAATANICNQGQCVANVGGDCTLGCTYVNGADPDPAVTTDDSCVPVGTGPTGCNGGYHGNVTAACAKNKLVAGTCTSTCACVLN